MKTQHIFYLLGVFAVIKGILILFGVDLPRRDGTIIENPIDYAEKAILFGIFTMLLTFIVARVNSREKNEH